MNNLGKANRFIYTLLYFAFSVFIMTGLVLLIFSDLDLRDEPTKTSKIDDWAYGSDKAGRFFGSTKSVGGLNSLSFSVPQTAVMDKSNMGMAYTESESIGFSVGGAKDINNFRENIKNDYLPLETDISYEGLFYDYYFDTGEQGKCQQLFCPTYQYAVSPDPVSEENDYYLSVGLNSGMNQEDFARKKLNLVVVLDISGSMGSSFNSYYYDKYGRKILNDEDKRKPKSKMEIAKESLVSLLGHLRGDDRFGMVLFDDNAYLAKPLRLVTNTDMIKIKKHILEINDRGGTRMSAGMNMGTKILFEYIGVDEQEYENRIIFLTDAMPNLGDTSKEGLFSMVEENAKNKLYTTFIGIGVDFSSELVEKITKTRGSNYYSVHSADEFKTRLDDEFEFMVTPLVFDLVLKLDSSGYDIEKVYGSPEADEATGEIMRVNTLFPSSRKDGKSKGGIILLKLKKNNDENDLKLSVSYEDRKGAKRKSEEKVGFNEDDEFYTNSGIQKGILLTRYADLMKNWILDTRLDLGGETEIFPAINSERGIIVPDMIPRELSEWERQSTPLMVSDKYKEIFFNFGDYFVEQKNILGDASLNKELVTIAKLGDSPDLIDDKDIRIYEVGELLKEPVFNETIIISGRVDKLQEEMSSSFEIYSGSEKIKVWYSLMVEDDGRELESVSIESINNGDQIMLTGILKPGGKYHSRLDFWAFKIEKIGGDEVVYTTYGSCKTACESGGFNKGECMEPGQTDLTMEPLGACLLDYSSTCGEEDDCYCYCSKNKNASSSK